MLARKSGVPNPATLLTNTCSFASCIPNRHASAWSDIKYQKLFLDRFAKQRNIEKFTDWYKIARQDVKRKGGGQLFQHYGSLYAALKGVYPQYPWEPSRFAEEGKKAPAGYWRDNDNLLRALDRVEQKLGITEVEDWYSVSMSDLREHGFPSKITRMNLAQILGMKYPHHDWAKLYILKGRFSQQRRLEKAVSALFQDKQAITNARKEGGIINPETGSYLELDIYVPSLKLAFEYQDLHHYKSVDNVYSPVKVHEERDALKSRLVKQHGIDLVIIPCWWDGNQDSLVASIRQMRPDLLQEYPIAVDPIPLEMPEDFSNKIQSGKKKVEGIGEPITACFLAATDTDPTNWFMFEKYDGIRAFWNPESKQFYSRHGTLLPVPQKIKDSMPTDLFTDGEIWFGRNNFQEALKVSSRAEMSKVHWDKFNYMVFDIPNMEGPYEQRYSRLEGYLESQDNMYMKLAPVVKCKGTNHLEEFLQNILSGGGEGIILRDPLAPYQSGRSSSFLKHKKFRDAEAKVVQNVGPYQWECELPNGVTFTAVPGTKGFVEKWKPQTGDIISFKHRGFLLGSGKPKSPTIYRIRSDLTWEDVIAQFKESKPREVKVPSIQKAKGKEDRKPKGYWTEISNRVKFFEEMAQAHHFDPLQPINWLNITKAQILATKGGAAVLSLYGGDVTKALQQTFPSMNFGQRERKLRNGYWRDINNRRRFFTEFAEEKGFDPLEPKNWDTITTTQIYAKQGGASLLNNLYKGSLTASLRGTFPELF